jgi:hypothetical protein
VACYTYLTAFIVLEGSYFNFAIQHVWHGGQVHPFIITKECRNKQGVFKQIFRYP